jgi:hypothetical protein
VQQKTSWQRTGGRTSYESTTKPCSVRQVPVVGGDSDLTAVLTENTIRAGLASLRTATSDSIGDEVRQG